jgi:hypothetical protein
MHGTAAAVCAFVRLHGGAASYRELRAALPVTALELDAVLQGLAFKGAVRTFGGKFYVKGHRPSLARSKPVRRICAVCLEAGRRYADKTALLCNNCTRQAQRAARKAEKEGKLGGRYCGGCGKWRTSRRFVSDEAVVCKRCTRPPPPLP